MSLCIVDSPIIISGERLLIINPLENQSYRVCHTIRLKKIFRKKKYEKIRDIFNKVLDTGKGNDMFKISIEALQSGQFQGISHVEYIFQKYNMSVTSF